MATAVGDRLSTTRDGPATRPRRLALPYLRRSNPIELDACTVCGTVRRPDAPGRGATLRGAVGGDAGLPAVSGPRHKRVGRGWTDWPGAALFAILATMAIVVLASGLESAIATGVWLSSWSAPWPYTRGRLGRRITSPPGDALVSSKALSWVSVGVVLGSVALLAIAAVSAAR